MAVTRQGADDVEDVLRHHLADLPFLELLAGRFSKGVMERICQPRTGLFPSPAEIKLSCSCPAWATMCKHVAAVLYGVGARLDERPELLFKLRAVDERDLVAEAGKELSLAKKGRGSGKVLEGDDLPPCRYLTPALTTVRQDIRAKGAAAVSLAAGASSETRIVQPLELVVRESTARRRKTRSVPTS